MRAGLLVLLVVLGAAAVWADSPAAGPGSSECLALGFADSLQCKECDALKEAVPDEKLYLECRSCCSDVEETIYQKAWVEVSQISLPRFPHVEEFLKKYAQEFQPHLEIKYLDVSVPFLHLQRAGGKIDSFRLVTWKTEDINQFLKEKLRPIM